MGGARSGEFDLIARYFAPLAGPGALGLKDDAALVTPSQGCELVVTSDTVIAGVHFRENDAPDLIAKKALRVNLSDLAAKGAKPVGFLHALTLNRATGDDWLEPYARGLGEDAREFAVPLLGGDTTVSPGPVTITITALGEVPAGTALLRSGARPGDILYVTGTIGDGALGLACLMGDLLLPRDDRAALTGRYHLPRPRAAAGIALRGIATAALDVSDGLVADAGHLAAASNAAIIIDRDAVPLSPAARKAVTGDPRLWERVLAGGDDYEIAFTAPAGADIAGIAANSGVALTAIGRVTAGAGVTVMADGAPLVLSSSGYRHR